MRVLFAEDERQLRETIARGLREASYAVDAVAGGDEAVVRAAKTTYDVIILDILMAKGNGIAACRALRRAGSDVPILLLTALDSLDDKIKGLDAGADDYLTKPFQFGELLARLRALTRRRPEVQSSEIVVGDLVIDPARRAARRGAREISLTAKEYAFLEYLARNSDRVVPRAELHAHVWDEQQNLMYSNLIDVYASRLRKKIDEGEAAPLLSTQRSMGFRLHAPHSASKRAASPPQAKGARRSTARTQRGRHSR